MALCTEIIPYYSQTFLQNLCSTTIETALDTSIINPFQFAERLVRSLSVEIAFPKSTANPIYNQTKSFHGNSKFLEKEFYFLGIEDDHHRYYSTKKAYPNPLEGHQISSPPTGYQPISIQLLARHGSRSLNGHDYDARTLQIWRIAKEKQMLTPLGEQLKEDTELFMQENNHIGRGELTQLGKEEQYGLGKRLYSRCENLFLSSKQISVITSGKKRAMDSAEEFLHGLIDSECQMEICQENSDKNLLYFHKSCPEYLKFKKTNMEIKQILISIKNSDQTRKFARQVLRKIYKNEFVELLINDQYRFPGDENIHPEERIQNEVAIVLCLYSMFAVSPAQNQQNLSRMLAKYFNREESNWFAYINDTQEFYYKGPSLQGTTVTSDMAKPLFTHFISSIDACIQSTSNTAVHLRFAHAETVIPFANLLQIPNFSDQASHSSDFYTYENNPWRGDRIAPMAANIQWEIYQHQNHSEQILIRMLYNEAEVRFKEDCPSITPNSFFYDYNQFKQSYAHLLSSLNDNLCI